MWREVFGKATPAAMYKGRRAGENGTNQQPRGQLGRDTLNGPCLPGERKGFYLVNSIRNLARLHA